MSVSQLSFTAIDFETANAKRESACAVGLAKVREGRVVARFSQLVAPPPGFNYFHWRNVNVHGIEESDVADSPRWDVVHEDVANFVGDDTLVAHNAPFDKSVLRASNRVYSLAEPTNDWVDTLALARRLLTLGSYRLPMVMDALGLTRAGFKHHDASDDAFQAAKVLIALAGKTGARTVQDLQLEGTGRQGWGRPGGGLGAGGSGAGGSGAGRKPVASDFAGVSAKRRLTGETVVVTGSMAVVNRCEAEALVESLGGKTWPRVTQKTTILVAGQLSSGGLRLGETPSRKLQYALELAGKGHPIVVLSEEDFLALIGVDKGELRERVRQLRGGA